MDGIVMPTSPSVPQPSRTRMSGAPPGGPSRAMEKPRVRRAGRRVLIVEDEAMIAGLIETILSTAGWSVVGPVATVDRALETIERETSVL